MRVLKAVLYAQGGVTLPLAYNEYLQGLLYSCWRENFSGLHDGTGQRFFTFGRLEGACDISRERKQVRFNDLASFEVRSPLEDLVDELAAQLAKRAVIRIGPGRFRLVNLKSEDRLLFPETTRIRMRAPLTAHIAEDDGHTRYLSPDDQGFQELLQKNLDTKMGALGAWESPRLQIMKAPGGSCKKQVTTFKGTWITGWMGDFILSAPPEAMSVLYHAGIGARGSQGFGMFDIEDRPL